MKKLIYLIVVIVALSLIVAGCGLLTAPPSEESELDKAKPEKCTTIKDGILEYSTGHYLDGTPLIVGYDIFGYNYQAHMFNGSYANAYLGRPGAAFSPYEGDDDTYLAENPGAEDHWTWPYRDVQLMMKWNDAWLSNKDCGEDDELDRHYGYDSYIGSGAWITNHMWGSYYNDIFVDEFDIGDTGSEVGHNLEGWSDPVAWTSGYGGGSDDGTFRLLMGRGDDCVDCEDAYFTMNTNGAVVDKLILHHLDGQKPDDFDVWLLDYIDGSLVEHYILIGSYDAAEGAEDWVTTEHTFLPRSGELKFKLVATSPITEWCLTWGQVAFSWAKLESPCYWDYFVKIVAAPEDANKIPENADGDKILGTWFTADKTEIGPVIWGAFAIIQEVENDPCADIHGLQYLSPAGPGLGKWESGISE